MASTQVDEKKVEPGIRGFLGEHLALLRAHFGFSGFERNRLYRNRRNGSFEDVSGISRVDSIRDGRGAVFLDYDDDGDLDLFLRSMHGPAHFLYRNDAGDGKPSLRVTLRGTASGRDAFGAVVRVHTDRGVLSRIKSGGEGFLGQHDPRLLFGLDGRKIARIDVSWPSGRRQTVRPDPGTRALEIVEPR